eukprot:06193.XXX_216761_217712_1 [CDS] Oithona nana genome sequencing.
MAFDTHCHLDFIQQKLEGLENSDDNLLKGRLVFKNFRELKEKYSSEFTSDFRGCITNFCDPGLFMNKNYEEMFKHDQDVWYTFGVHPHFSDQLDSSAFCALKNALKLPRVVALGEMGLDYKKTKCSKEMQKSAFRVQLRLAMQLKLPIVLHIRNADEDGLQIMAEESIPPDHPIHLHCFTGCWVDCQSWMKRYTHLKVGFTIVEGLTDVVKNIPLDKILLETDAPYFFKGTRSHSSQHLISHPGHVQYVAKKVAELKEVPYTDVINANLKNAIEVYNLA